MESLLAILSGLLVAAGIFCLLQRSLARLVIGIIILGQAANLIIFTAAGLKTSNPAIISEGSKSLSGLYADPLPQAIVLTAIVIGFGFTAFLLALLHRTYKTLKTEDIEELKNTDTEL
jgi:multicomponent Na+:H+ antiporter subunit C